MAEPEQCPQDSAASGNPSLSRRNLPRASHACQRCRAKKARCDQRQPCANCIKHSHNCMYGIRKRNGQNRNSRVWSPSRREIEDRQVHFRSPASTREGQDEPLGSETLERSQGSARLVFAQQSLPVDNADVVGDVNQHTHGTEFYGTSSNFVLLNQLFAYAQQHLPPGHASSSNRNETSYLSPSSVGSSEQCSFPDQNGPWTSGGLVSGVGHTALPPGRISIVNLLSNEEALSPPSRPKTPPHVTENQQDVSGVSSLALSRARDGSLIDSIQHDIPMLVPQNSQRGDGTSNPRSPAHLATKEKPAPGTPVRVAKRRLEREYVRLFMSNLHHLHPMLDPINFAARCEEEIWGVHTPLERKKDLRHFFALYNIVVAVGALVAGSSVTQDFGRDINLCMEQSAQSQNSSLPISSQALSKSYFRKSKALLGDVFEVCSLESAQTLLLMSLYCQNSLKPHACYMYCGQAVRTALAIGLASESVSSSAEDRKAARRTWWCIYSHEIDMSCSSGRRDSLGKPRNYQIHLPSIKAQNATVTNILELENSSVAMINQMVHFAAVLRRISKELYHDSKGLTLLQKSAVAKDLDTLLDDWKARLPEGLDFGQVSFRGEEWAAKQKLVLHLRYLNAKILLHRPFLAAPMCSEKAQISRHVDLCLDAARDTIKVLYDAYANRHYFRTWWYNSTYTLYAGVIVLYIVMLGHNAVSSNELLDDVIKARDILQSMEEVIVAQRSAKLIREGLEVAWACVQSRQNLLAGPEGTHLDHGSQGQVDLNNMTFHSGNDFSQTLFSYAVPGQGPGSLLASLIDPNLLQDLTAGENNMSDLEFSTFPFDGLFGDGLDVDLTSIVM